MTGTPEHTIDSYEQIAVYYEDHEAQVPVLDDDLVLAMKGFLRAHGCSMIGGSIATDPTSTIGHTLSLGRSNLINRRNDTFVGPHILDDTYYPSAVGVWTSGDIGPIR